MKYIKADWTPSTSKNLQRCISNLVQRKTVVPIRGMIKGIGPQQDCDGLRPNTNSVDKHFSRGCRESLYHTLSNPVLVMSADATKRDGLTLGKTIILEETVREAIIIGTIGTNDYAVT